jgi:hypothetical protein
MRERGTPALLFFHAGIVLLFVLLAACSPNRRSVPPPDPVDAGRTGVEPLRVRVTFREAVLPGARVEFRGSPVEPAEAPVSFGRTDREGIASVQVPPGRYFLIARWAKDGDFSRPVAPGDRYAYFGGNPVYVQPGPQREIFLGLEEYTSPPGSLPVPSGVTGVAGVVLDNGVPAPDVRVSAYLASAGGFRDLGFAASAPTGPDGGFVLDLPPGKYYLLARKRAGGGVAGPLRKGDLFGYFPGNPVTITQGKATRVALPASSLKLRNTPVYSAGYTAPASIEGRILDMAGQPVRGAYAALYDNPDLLNRPVFLSDVTGADGIYRLPVPVPGKYFLGARSGYGGSPAPGDLYGRYEGNPEHSVVLKEGDRMGGVDLVVTPVR